MNKYLKLFLFAFAISGSIIGYEASASDLSQDHQEISHEATDETVSGDHAEEAHHGPAGWSVIPFAVLLLMIATGPLFYEHFWHKNYPKVAVALAVLVVSYYLFGLGNHHSPVHALFEYVQFIALLTGLFVASGGIMIIVDKKAAPLTNVALLAFGAIIANIIGTTGASMLLIRPFIRLNKNRIKSYHIIFSSLSSAILVVHLLQLVTHPSSLVF